MKRSSARLAGILLLASFLRFGGVWNDSFYHYDEGETAKSALGPAVAVRWVLRTAWGGDAWTPESLKAEYERYGFPYPRTSARPGYLALATLSMAWGGISDKALIVLSAVMGVATVWIVYLTLRRIGEGEGDALPFWGALALAVSPTHVFFSRTGFAHVTAGFFLALAVYWHFREREAPRRTADAFRAGLACGYAFTCHFNVAWALAVLVGTRLGGRFLAGGKGAWKAAFLDAAVVGVGASVPILFFQVATVSAAFFFRDWLPDQTTYLQDLRGQWSHLFHYCNPRAQASPFFYAIFWLRTETVGLIAGTLIGTFLAWRNRRSVSAAGALLLAALLVWIPYAAMSAMSWKVARTLVPCLPFAAMLWGYAFSRWRAEGAAGRWGKALCVAVFLAIPLVRDMNLLRGHGHFRGVVEDLRAKGRSIVAVDEFPTVDFYAGFPGAVLVYDWKGFERIGPALSEGGTTFVALYKDGAYGCDDPVYANRYGFIQDLLARGARPDHVLPFHVPVDFDYVDSAWRFDRLLSLADVRYEVHLFDVKADQR